MDSALMDTAAVHGVFYLIALASAVWLLGPGIMHALGKQHLGAEINEDAVGAEPPGDDPDYQRWYRELYALGYRPAGTTFEVGRYISPVHWRYRSGLQRWMVSADRKTYIDFFRIPGRSTLWFYAMTIFEGGGAVRTAHKPEKQNPSPGGNYKYFELLRTDPVQLLEEHRQNVSEFCEERGLVAKRATFREVCDEDIALTRRTIPKTYITGMYAVVASMYLIPAIPFLLLLVRRPDFAPWFIHTSVGLCLVALIFTMVKWMVLPSRVPMAIKTIPMAAVICLPVLFTIHAQDAEMEASKRVSAMLDQLASNVDQGFPIDATIDRVVALGAGACRQTLVRMDRTASAARKQAFHLTLIRLHGSDLGDTYRAWLPWCREAYRHR